MIPAASAILAVGALVLLASAGPAADTRSVTDSAGRSAEVPMRVERVYAAGGPASIFLYTLAPTRMLGWTRALGPEERAFAPARFGYPGKEVGHGVSFSLAGGEVLCLLAPRRGGVIVDGEPVAGWSRRRLARVFGYVPQAPLGVFPFTVAEIVLMGRTAHIGPFATPSHGDRAVAEEMLAVLGIGHLPARPYTEISGGERQLTLIARALAQPPAILVMDEPTASLDFGNQVRVLGEIEHLARRGIAVMLSTHDPDHAFLCAHRVALLHEGRLARLGPPDEVITRESLREVYGVEVTVMEMACADGRVARVCVPTVGATGRGVPPGQPGHPS